MNRAERRKNAVITRPKTYVLTEYQIAEIKRKATEEAAQRAFLMFLAIPVMVLKDKFGFGKIRLTRFMDYALVWFRSVYDNETRLAEIVEIASKECGIRITDYKWEKQND